MITQRDSKILVTGMDPSLSNWGLVKAVYDAATGDIQVIDNRTITTTVDQNKTTRKNSKDIERTRKLFKEIRSFTSDTRILFAEVPTGSQGARAMTSYGACIGLLGALEALGLSLYQLDPKQAKKAVTGSPGASKAQMMEWALSVQPEVNWPRKSNGSINAGLFEHQADALATIYAGVQTSEFMQVISMVKTL